MSRSSRADRLLRAANPVPAALVPGPRRRSLWVPLALAAVGVCFLLVAPAVGIRIPVLDFWSAEKAPPKVVQDFASLSEGAPPGMDPGAIPGETRKVTLPDGQFFWVAPTRAGGLCTLGPRIGGGCDKLGTFPLSISWGISHPFRLKEGRAPDPRLFDVFGGWVNGRLADTVEIRFTDGETYRPALAWVSKPIDDGFFVYQVPAGREVRAVVALDGKGRVVTEQSPVGEERLTAPPSDALLEERKEVARLATRNGDAVVWQAPTRYDGRCAWLELDGRKVSFAGCMPRGYSFGRPVRFVQTRSDVLVVGALKDVAKVVIRFADGESMSAEPKRGFLLAEIPASHLVPGKQATSLVMLDDRGKELVPPVPVGALGGSR